MSRKSDEHGEEGPERRGEGEGVNQDPARDEGGDLEATPFDAHQAVAHYRASPPHDVFGKQGAKFTIKY